MKPYFVVCWHLQAIEIEDYTIWLYSTFAILGTIVQEENIHHL